MAGKNFVIDVPIYPISVMVSIEQSNSELIAKVNRWIPDKTERLRFVDCIEDDLKPNSAGLVYHLDGTGWIIIRMTDHIKTPENRGALAHEIFHAVERIAIHSGLLHCEKSSEAFAYLIQFLTTEIYKKI